MPRPRRFQTVRSQGEYRAEPQCQPTPQTRSRAQLDYVSRSPSPAHVNPHAEETSDSESYTSIDHEEGDEVFIEDENGERNCGKTKLADLWNLPPGHRVVVVCNARGQPVKNEGRLLAQFLGTIARDGRICTLSHNDWRYAKKDSEVKILTAVKAKFLYPVRCENWILKSTGKKWKDHKCDLKATYFDEGASLKELYSKAPEDVVNDQWISLVNFWKSDAGKARSLRNKRSRAMLKMTHTAGTKSFARVAEEMRQKHPEKKEPQRAEVYLSTHKYKDGTYMDERLAFDLQKKMAENLEASTSQGQVAWKGDAFSEIIGKDKQGYVRGLGLGPSPREIFKPSCSCFCEGTIVEETMRQIKEHVERLEQQVQNQSQTIAELKCKVRCLESLLIQAPDHLCCKITLDIFRDPVITPSGVTYERAVLYEHLQKVGKFDPITREPLEPHQLVPNLAVKEAVRAFLDEHGWSYKMCR